VTAYLRAGQAYVRVVWSHTGPGSGWWTQVRSKLHSWILLSEATTHAALLFYHRNPRLASSLDFSMSNLCVDLLEVQTTLLLTTANDTKDDCEDPFASSPL
jgi:hypothetical protein